MFEYIYKEKCYTWCIAEGSWFLQYYFVRRIYKKEKYLGLLVGYILACEIPHFGENTGSLEPDVQYMVLKFSDNLFLQ